MKMLAVAEGGRADLGRFIFCPRHLHRAYVESRGAKKKKAPLEAKIAHENGVA